MILWLRSLIFNIAFYSTMGGVTLLVAWTLFMPDRYVLLAAHICHSAMAWVEKHVGGISYKVVGREYVPEGACIIAAKHQSEWETYKMNLLFGNPSIVFKKELMRVPVWGGFLRRTGMIPIDRSGGGGALSVMMRAAHKAADAGRKIVIFPQGTRITPGEQRPYKSGVAALYQELNLPVVPMAVNSGLFWPKSSFIKKPGEITIEFLPAIPAGLPREEMMNRLKHDLETASDRLAGITKA